MNEAKWSRQVPNYGIRFISEKKCEVTILLLTKVILLFSSLLYMSCNFYFYQFVKCTTTYRHELLTNMTVVLIEFPKSFNIFSYQCIFIYSVAISFLIFVHYKNDPYHLICLKTNILARLDWFPCSIYQLRMLIIVSPIPLIEHAICTELFEHVLQQITWGGHITAQQIAFMKLSNLQSGHSVISLIYNIWLIFKTGI